MQLHLIEDYKKLGFSKGLLSLWSGKLILDFGINVFSLYLPIFLYQQYGASINLVILWYLAHSLGYVLLAPLGGRLMNKIGLKTSLIIGTILRLPYFYAFYKFPEDPLLYSILTAVFLVLIRSTFWLPFQTDSAKFSDKKHRGKQFGIIFSVASILSIIAPVIGGFVIEGWSYSVLIIIALIICAVSVIPFFFLPQIKEEVSWSYTETFKYFLHPFNKRMVVAYMSDGAIGCINGLFWPIFMFSLVNEEFKTIGLLTGGILLTGVMLRLFIGGLLDKFQKIKLVRVGTVLSSTAWLFKVAVASVLQIFVASVYHTLAIIVLRTSLDTLVYEKAADRGHYIDEYTLIKEMSIHSGKVISLLVIALLLLFFPIQASFVVAAILALFISLLR